MGARSLTTLHEFRKRVCGAILKLEMASYVYRKLASSHRLIFKSLRYHWKPVSITIQLSILHPPLMSHSSPTLRHFFPVLSTLLTRNVLGYSETQ